MYFGIILDFSFPYLQTISEKSDTTFETYADSTFHHLHCVDLHHHHHHLPDFWQQPLPFLLLLPPSTLLHHIPNTGARMILLKCSSDSIAPLSETLSHLLISLLSLYCSLRGPHEVLGNLHDLMSYSSQSSSHCSGHTGFLTVQICQDFPLTCTCCFLCPEHSSLRYLNYTSDSFDQYFVKE